MAWIKKRSKKKFSAKNLNDPDIFCYGIFPFIQDQIIQDQNILLQYRRTNKTLKQAVSRYSKKNPIMLHNLSSYDISTFLDFLKNNPKAIDFYVGIIIAKDNRMENISTSLGTGIYSSIDDDVQGLLRFLKDKLKKLVLINLDLEHISFENFPESSITHLAFIECDNISKKKHFDKLPKSLETLIIRGSYYEENELRKELCFSEDKYFCSLPNIKTLKIDNYKSTLRGHFFKRLPKTLEEFSLKNCHSIQAKNINDLLSLSKLKTLCISTDYINTDWYKKLPLTITTLHIKRNDKTKEILQNIADKNIETLDISDISEFECLYFALQKKLLTYLPKTLKRLKVFSIENVEIKDLDSLPPKMREIYIKDDVPFTVNDSDNQKIIQALRNKKIRVSTFKGLKYPLSK
ncbi:hypothetical protein ACFLYA_02215 [Candidatus Dependentiae bacterium]